MGQITSVAHAPTFIYNGECKPCVSRLYRSYLRYTYITAAHINALVYDMVVELDDLLIDASEFHPYMMAIPQLAEEEYIEFNRIAFKLRFAF